MDTVQKHPRADMGLGDLPTSPYKKQKLQMASSTMPMECAMQQPPKAGQGMGARAACDLSQSNEHQAKEATCGITEFVTRDLLGFAGTVKKRYTDFQVNEILPSGQVVHLNVLKAPKPETEQEPRNGAKSLTTSPKVKNHEEPPQHASPAIKAEVMTRILEQHPPPTKEDGLGRHSSDQTGPPSTEESLADSLKGNAPPIQLSQETSTPSQTKESLVSIATLPTSDPSVDPASKISPHKRIPPPSPLIPPNMQETDGKRSDEDVRKEPEKSIRQKETVLIRQTREGWVEVDQEQEQKLKYQRAAEDAAADVNSGNPTVVDLSKKKSMPEEVRYEAKPSTQAQWHAFAGAESSSGTPSGFQLQPEDKKSLLTYFGSDIIDAIVSLYSRIVNSPHRKSKDYGTVKSSVIDRETRSKIHQEIRRIFNGRLESTTDNHGAIIIAAMAEKAIFHARTPMDNGRNQKQNQQRGPSWKERGGDYLHFSLFKENKDTMEAILWLSKDLKTKPNNFQFAGTKDKRAVTVQRVSVYRVLIDRLIAAGRGLRGAKIGNFEYRPHPLQLGELNGNEFVVTLRDCDFYYPVPIDSQSMVEGARSIVGSAVKNLTERGFINYYGLQRFGTFSIRTDEVGVSMLQGNFKAAVDAILDFNPASLAAAQDLMSDTDRVSRDDQARAHALNTFKTIGNAYLALRNLPRKFSAETNIIRHLSHRGKDSDHLGALQTIPRNLRLMYVHAYQSLVWNVAASERWKRFASTVVEGDLVLIDEHTDKTEPAIKSDDVDEDGEAIVHPSADDRATDPEGMFTRARTLTKQEAESGKYTIFDIVLPTPGYDILYPANGMRRFYAEFMGSERGGGLNPHDMRRKWKDVSLSGSYRKFLARPLNKVSFEVKVYKDEDEQFVETDLDRLCKGNQDKVNRNHHHISSTTDTNAMDVDGKDNKSHKGSETETKSEFSDNEPGGVKLSGGLYKDFKIAVILTLQLGSSQYATMALRELMKLGGIKTYKPDFSGGR